VVVEARVSLEKLFNLIDHLDDGVFVIENGCVVYGSEVLLDLLGYSEEEALGQPFERFIAERSRPMVVENYRARLAGENPPKEYEFYLLTKDNQNIIVRINVGVYKDEQGNLSSIGSVKDLRASKKTMKDLARSKNDIESILNNMPDVFYRTDIQGIVTLMSPSVKDVLDFTPEEMIGKPLSDFYCTPSDRERILKALEDGQGKAAQVEACLKNKDGTGRWILTNAYMRMNETGEPVGVEGIARDITERKDMEDKLLRYARYDDLTQIYNRRIFYNEAEKQMDIAHRYHRPAAVLMMDLDHFKNVNDHYGHHTGDEVLKNFSSICQQAKRHTDVIGRTGGEEFAIFMPETDLDDAVRLAERIGEHTRKAMVHVDGNDIHYTVSIGVAVLKPGVTKIDDFLSSADKALYQAKEAGRDCVKVFE